MQYRVNISKFCYVMADCEEEAKDKALEGDTVYEEEAVEECSAVDDFSVAFSEFD